MKLLSTGNPKLLKGEKKGYMSFVESQREQGKLRSVIKAILKASAGRKHTDSIPLEVVVSSTGHMIITPDELDTECTNH